MERIIIRYPSVSADADIRYPKMVSDADADMDMALSVSESIRWQPYPSLEETTEPSGYIDPLGKIKVVGHDKLKTKKEKIQTREQRLC